ncbi:TonB family protein [Sphingomonas profundi]|uniref:TonB family protein n=1 Tax=Alterirhizorhabdus profundi TaxID=2681549 RepID=UPI0012E808CF|nr:TonB family protein [Sphingomonas profundi]
MIAITDVRRVAVATLGALLLSATCVAGAVGTARAAAPTLPNAPLTVADWQDDVGRQLDAQLAVPASAFAHRSQLIATVDVSFDRDGGFAGARIARSSGVSSVDRSVVRVAERIAYPPLPEGYRGRPQTVSMQAYFGLAATPEEAARHEAAIEALATRPSAKHDAVQTAALPSG